jgi:hypothetical protein
LKIEDQPNTNSVQQKINPMPYFTSSLNPVRIKKSIEDIKENEYRLRSYHFLFPCVANPMTAPANNPISKTPAITPHVCSPFADFAMKSEANQAKNPNAKRKMIEIVTQLGTFIKLFFS